MNKIAISTVTAVILLGFAGIASAQGMMGGYGTATASQASSSSSSDTGDTAGATILAKLQSKQLSCSQLTDADYAALGDYYMGQMMGSAHDQMDQYMAQSIGQQGDEQMHIALGERLSGCNTAAAYPTGGSGFFPMMMSGYGMMGGYGAPFGYGMMYGGYGYWWGELLSIALWVFAIIGVVAVLRWMIGKRQVK